MEGEEEEESRLSRQKKKSRLSLDDVPERQSNEAVKEEAPNLGSPPLRLKIKLTPEITKSLDSATDSPSKATGPTRKPSTRPQPTPLVESLGVDVPTPQALALLNKLPHAMDAFSRGSVPRRQPSKPSLIVLNIGEPREGPGGFPKSHCEARKRGLCPVQGVWNELCCGAKLEEALAPCSRSQAAWS